MRTFNRYINIRYEQGLNDCYTRLMDFFEFEYGMTLTNYARPDNWAYVGLDFFETNFQNEGFSAVNICPNNPRFGDVLLMTLERAPVVNHVAVYVGHNKIMHHLRDQLSCVEEYTYRWQSRVRKIVRHPVVESQTHLTGLSSIIDRLPSHLKNRLRNSNQ